MIIGDLWFCFTCITLGSHVHFNCKAFVFEESIVETSMSHKHCLSGQFNKIANGKNWSGIVICNNLWCIHEFGHYMLLYVTVLLLNEWISLNWEWKRAVYCQGINLLSEIQNIQTLPPNPRAG